MFYGLSKVFWVLAEPSNFLVLAALGGLLLGLCGFRRALFGAGGAMLLLLVAGFGPVGDLLLRPLEDRFPVHSGAGKIAGVIVLGGVVEGEVVRARSVAAVNEAAERLDAMAALARQHPAATIVFTGGADTMVMNTPPEADMVARLLPWYGLAPDRVKFESASRNTLENARMTRAEHGTGASGEGAWLLVTSAWHMPRAMGVFRKAGFPVTAYPVDFRTQGAEGPRWWTGSMSRGLRRTDLAAKEWVGLMAYWLAGYTDALFPAP